jgi:hypothetical protein
VAEGDILPQSNRKPSPPVIEFKSLPGLTPFADQGCDIIVWIKNKNFFTHTFTSSSEISKLNRYSENSCA